MYASTLYDATYLYATSLSRVINASNINPSVYRDGSNMLKTSSNISFEGYHKWFFTGIEFSFIGLSGTVTIGEDGIRNSIYMLSIYEDKQATLKPWMSFVVADGGGDFVKK